MKTVDIEKIIEQSGKDRVEIAKGLFPHSGYPVLVLKRIENKTQLLNTEQVVRLSDLTGIPIADLFTEAD